MPDISLDHCVIHITDWARSNSFYRSVFGAEVIANDGGYVYRFGLQQLNVHGPGVRAEQVARIPVPPGGSDLCFRWSGTIEMAIEHLHSQGISIETPVLHRHGARGQGRSVYFRDPDGSLLEFISYE